MIVHIYNTTPVEYNQFGVSGFNYQALKDNIQWHGMSKKRYVPILLKCMSSFLSGTSK